MLNTKCKPQAVRSSHGVTSAPSRNERTEHGICSNHQKEPEYSREALAMVLAYEGSMNAHSTSVSFPFRLIAHLSVFLCGHWQIMFHSSTCSLLGTFLAARIVLQEKTKPWDAVRGGLQIRTSQSPELGYPRTKLNLRLGVGLPQVPPRANSALL